jgi:hypothetical protein
MTQDDEKEIEQLRERVGKALETFSNGRVAPDRAGAGGARQGQQVKVLCALSLEHHMRAGITEAGETYVASPRCDCGKARARCSSRAIRSSRRQWKNSLNHLPKSADRRR